MTSGACGRGTLDWQNQQVPRHTLFLWTAHEPWVAHSWLSGLVFYGLLRLADSETYLMRIFTASMTVLTFALLWRFWRRCAADHHSDRLALFAGHHLLGVSL